MKEKIAKILIFIFVFIVLVGLVFGGNFFFKLKTGGGVERDNELTRLKEENQSLKNKLKQYEGLKDNSEPVFDFNYLLVDVYSGYPFNIKKIITLGAGEKQRVEKEMPIVFESVLIGQIEEVFKNYSVAKTIFDPNWQIPVVIGKGKIDGLLEGGVEPKINLIPMDAEIKNGEIIFPANPKEFPKGFYLGKIGEIKESLNSPFLEALLLTPYNLNEIKEAYIITDF